MYKKLLFLLFGLFGVSVFVAGHAQTYDGTVNSLVAVASKYQAEHRSEKVYVQLDRANYGLNDTLWLKAYLFDASSLRPSAKSKLLYIELSDETNIVQVRKVVVMNKGLGSGCIPLSKRDFPEGGYTLRAYTQWMRNFDESLVFKKQFYVGNINRDRWLLKLNTAVAGNNGHLHLQIVDPDKKTVKDQPLQLSIKQGEKVLQWDKTQITSNTGTLDLDIPVTDKQETRYAYLQKDFTKQGGGFMGLSSSNEIDKSAPQYKFPVIINRPEKTDVQFMPEGGYMIENIHAIVGFKAISEDGKGVDITGSIVNTTNNEEVAKVSSLHNGMGSFTMTPKANTTYKAVITLPDGTKKEYPLPKAKASGTALSVIANKDSLAIKIKTTPDQPGRYMLIGRSRGLVCFAVRTILNRANNYTQTFKAAKSDFATGIARFTLLNEQLNTLNERQVFVNNNDALQIRIVTDKKSYATQDSIALHIEVKDKDNEPVQGAFSLAVVNDMPLTSPDNTNIISNTLLTADLKGYVETPNYYFAQKHEKELDNLLLTQGWTSFDWKQIAQPDKPMPFTAEPDIEISGKVSNLFNKGVKGAKLNLLSLKPLYDKDTLTDDKGNFTFKHLPQIDSALYIRARNGKGNAATYGIDINKAERPQFGPNRIQLPWFVNTDTAKLRIADTLLSRKEKQELPEGLSGKVLKEVAIVDKKIIPGSRNLNGPGNADEIIDEHDIAKEKPMTLLELLQKKVPGFRTVHTDRLGRYFIRTEHIDGFIIDGVDTRVSGFNLYDILTYFSSDDIKGIEVMYKVYTSPYFLKFYPNPILAPPFPVPYIEITTREGKGPFMKKHPADVVYKPIPSVLQNDFYRPRYAVKNPAVAAFDERSTIHWEPNIITDKNGQATVSFYVAGQPGTYTITTEGSDMNGGLGTSTQKLTIKPSSP